MSSSTAVLQIEGPIAATIRSLAESRHAAVEDVLQEALEFYSRRLDFFADAEAASRDLDETGLHVTQQEIEAWVDGLATDPKRRLPECHKQREGDKNQEPRHRRGFRELTTHN
jgi:predicted transcriptional regulator